jgi:hypothetical protein
VVERFLQEEEKPPVLDVGEDLLSKAARALENMEPRSERSEALELPPLEMPEAPTERRDFRDLWPVEGFQMPEEPISEALHPEEEEDLEPVSSKSLDLPDLREERIEDAEEEKEITRVDSLPDVITADMLRARKNKSLDTQDFVVPAELLVGLDEEELEEDWEEEEDKRGRGSRGGKAPAKATGKKSKKPAKPESKSKGKKWRPQRGGDDDF